MRFLWILLLLAPVAQAEDFRKADRAWDWQFPRDHGSHHEFQTEWWYFTGSVQDEAGERFGYELTFFRFALAREMPADASRFRARDLILAHFSITDVARGEFFLSEDLQRAAAGLAGAEAGDLNVWMGDWSARADGDAFVLRAGNAGEHRIELRLVPERDPIRHGENGLSWKRADKTHASYYYSIPRLRTTGRMELPGREFAVEGMTWMDQEFFTGDTPVEGLGWDWFSCRLDDGRDLMLYLLRYPDGTLYRSGTLVERDGTHRPLDPTDMTLEPGRRWTSPQTGATYPVSWRIHLPREDMHLEVDALLDEQEVHAEETVGFAYWEGLSRYTGEIAGEAISGEGYVELTGYGPQP